LKQHQQSINMRSFFIASALAGLSVTSLAIPLFKRDVTGPVFEHDFPDPSIIRVGDTWHAFGTQSIYDNTEIKTQYATSADFTTWQLHSGHDALRNLPAWVDQSQPKIWAPDVFALDDGSFMMYFSATTNTAGNGRFHCIGAASSPNIEGPYDSVSDSPLACPTNEGGAIDASAFRDANGTRFMLYKIDGNSIGNGGRCNNDVEPQRDTWLVLQQIASNGWTLVGEGKRILNRDPIDGPLIEGPSLVRYPGPKYVLHFSSNCYTDEHYSSSYAVADSLDGNFYKAKFPLLVTGTPRDVWGPGHADVDWDGQHMAFHGYNSKKSVGGRRFMYVARLSWNGDSDTVGLGI
jgi:beta-xylosidase